MEELQRWERLYLEIALHLDKYIEGFVDSYYGPPQLKQTIEAMEPLSIPKLESKCEELLAIIHELEFEESRKVYLLKQVHAMATSIKVLSGQQLGFLEEVNGYFDITPRRINDSELDRAITVLEILLGEMKYNHSIPTIHHL